MSPVKTPETPKNVPLVALRQRADFLRVQRSGVRAARPGLVLQVAPGLSADQIGLGLTTSRKVGNAVKRNRARRRLRALAQELLPSRGRPGLDYVLIGRHTTGARPWAKLQADLLSALDQVHKGL